MSVQKIRMLVRLFSTHYLQSHNSTNSEHTIRPSVLMLSCLFVAMLSVVLLTVMALSSYARKNL
jgi:hypothetical protein